MHPPRRCRDAPGPGRPHRLGEGRKVHLAADRKCRPRRFILTAGQAVDSPQFIPVLGKIRVRGPVGPARTRPDAVAGENAYCSRSNRAHPRRRDIKAVIPEKRGQAAHRKKNGGGSGGRPSARRPPRLNRCTNLSCTAPSSPAYNVTSAMAPVMTTFRTRSRSLAARPRPAPAEVVAHRREHRAVAEPGEPECHGRAQC